MSTNNLYVDGNLRMKQMGFFINLSLILIVMAIILKIADVVEDVKV